MTHECCESCGVALVFMPSVDGMCMDCYKLTEGIGPKAVPMQQARRPTQDEVFKMAEDLHEAAVKAGMFCDVKLYGDKVMLHAGEPLPGDRDYVEPDCIMDDFMKQTRRHIAETFSGKVTPSRVTQELVDQIVRRDAHGQAKYNASLDRGDLTLSQWLQHMAEELMDGAGYALAAKREHGQFETDVLAIVDRSLKIVLAMTPWHNSADLLATTIKRELGK